ncbi:MAG: hypothetical protein IPI35_21765 [Deltaproteobacteria bacterium]|nr:hypothetical protein [Deltaproteobacteria bacterium]
MTLIPLTLTLAFGLACFGGKDFEGDEAGECNDGVDNDQNGLFDCDEDACVGSPLCEEIPTDDTGGGGGDDTGGGGGGGDEVTLPRRPATATDQGYFYEVEITGRGSARALHLRDGQLQPLERGPPFPSTPSRRARMAPGSSTTWSWTA